MLLLVLVRRRAQLRALPCLLHELVDIDAAIRCGDTPAGQLVISDRWMLAEVNFLLLEPK